MREVLDIYRELMRERMGEVKEDIWRNAMEYRNYDFFRGAIYAYEHSLNLLREAEKQAVKQHYEG